MSIHTVHIYNFSIFVIALFDFYEVLNGAGTNRLQQENGSFEYFWSFLPLPLKP